MNISSQLIEYLQKDANFTSHADITYKFDGDNVAGTKVVLTLPLTVK